MNARQLRDELDERIKSARHGTGRTNLTLDDLEAYREALDPIPDEGPSIAIPVDGNWGIGPFSDTYGHGPIILFVPPGEKGAKFSACLDCGYLSDDVRRFAHEDCDRSKNGIAQTLRELIADEGYPDYHRW